MRISQEEMFALSQTLPPKKLIVTAPFASMKHGSPLDPHGIPQMVFPRSITSNILWDGVDRAPAPACLEVLGDIRLVHPILVQRGTRYAYTISIFSVYLQLLCQLKTGKKPGLQEAVAKNRCIIIRLNPEHPRWPRMVDYRGVRRLCFVVKHLLCAL